MKIVINEIPKSDNHFKGRENHWEYRSEKKRWNEMVHWICVTEKFKPIEGKAVVTIKYFWRTKARRDPDNYSGKFIMDGIVSAGLIKDDSFQCIKLVLDAEFGADKERTEITIEKEDI